MSWFVENALEHKNNWDLITNPFSKCVANNPKDYNKKVIPPTSGPCLNIHHICLAKCPVATSTSQRVNTDHFSDHLGVPR